MSAIKTKNLTIRVSEDFATTLKGYAKKRFMSQANLIEYLVRREIEQDNHQLKKRNLPSHPCGESKIRKGVKINGGRSVLYRRRSRS